MKGYHFTNGKLRDGRPLPPIGKWLTHEGLVVPCESGYHLSKHPFDALLLAPGCVLHRAELEGDLQSHGNPPNKYAGRRRRILATIDTTPFLRRFARLCALDVIHLWNAPAIVVRYLRTGDESLRDIAHSAAVEAAADAAANAALPDAAFNAADAAAYVSAYVAAPCLTSVARATAWSARTACPAMLRKQRRRFYRMVAEAFRQAGRESGKWV